MEAEGWYKVTIDLHDHKGGWTTLQDAFTRVLVLNGGRSDAAMYSRSQKGDLVTNLYFSPGAVSIAKTLILANGGTPSKRPPRQDTTCLVHNDNGPDPLDSSY
jgi:hypothetical protein